MNKLLISACLLGDRVRYDGRDNLVVDRLLELWQQQGRLVPVCPEVAGGLPIPREPAEIQSQDGKAVMTNQAEIITRSGQDVTQAFQQGAQMALALAREHGCRFALLAARSPSCGNEEIYNGQFNGTLKSGQGATAAWLSQHGVQVFNQEQIKQLAAVIDTQ